jgi:hypothetical protein
MVNRVFALGKWMVEEGLTWIKKMKRIGGKKREARNNI